jgi:hypothetical protein
MTTADWYITDFYNMVEGRGISGVAIFGWFTAEGEKKLLLNPNANILLTANEGRIINGEL